MMVELRDRLQAQIGTDTELSATIVFDYPTIADLARLPGQLDSLPDELPTRLDSIDNSSMRGGSRQAQARLHWKRKNAIDEMSEQQALEALLREVRRVRPHVEYSRTIRLITFATKLALLKIRELKQQLAEAEGQQHEGIAIVSMACRFPRHSDTPEAFWESLSAGNDEIGEIPPDRWDLDAYFDADPECSRQDVHDPRRVSGPHRSDGCRVLRHLAARSDLGRSAAAIADGSQLGGTGTSRLAVGSDRPAKPACSWAGCTTTTRTNAATRC